MINVIKTIDAHAGGAPLRLIVGGVPSPMGQTMAKKQLSFKRQSDHLRRALVLEPRGHADMCAALLTEPASPGAHAGILFMHNDGYSPLCGHALMAAATIAIERRLIVSASIDGADVSDLVFDTVAGSIRVRARVLQSGAARSASAGPAISSSEGAQPGGVRVDAVAFTAPASFVSAAGQKVAAGPRDIRIDIAFGGGFYAIVDTEAIGVPLDGPAVPELRRVAAAIKAAVDGSPAVVHPHDAALSGLEGVIFTGPPRDPEAHLRNVTVFADGAVDRSPSGTGTAAVMAVLDAMGLLLEDAPFVHESAIGTLFRGRVTRRTQIGDTLAIVPEIEGSAWITGEHTFLIDDEDPLREGMRLY
jgi:proline racemase